MDDAQRELRAQVEEVCLGMTAYMNMDPSALFTGWEVTLPAELLSQVHDPQYSAEDVEECRGILLCYLDVMQSDYVVGHPNAILGHVKRTILELNVLNERCGGDLIATDQREGICPILSQAAELAGLQSTQDDITLEWRDW